MAVEEYEIDWIQEQIYELQSDVNKLESKVADLQMENTLLRNDLNTIKMEGCWRFIQNKEDKNEN